MAFHSDGIFYALITAHIISKGLAESLLPYQRALLAKPDVLALAGIALRWNSRHIGDFGEQVIASLDWNASVLPLDDLLMLNEPMAERISSPMLCRLIAARKLSLNELRKLEPNEIAILENESVNGMLLHYPYRAVGMLLVPLPTLTQIHADPDLRSMLFPDKEGSHCLTFAEAARALNDDLHMRLLGDTACRALVKQGYISWSDLVSLDENRRFKLAAALPLLQTGMFASPDIYDIPMPALMTYGEVIPPLCIYVALGCISSSKLWQLCDEKPLTDLLSLPAVQQAFSLVVKQQNLEECQQLFGRVMQLPVGTLERVHAYVTTSAPAETGLQNSLGDKEYMKTVCQNVLSQLRDAVKRQSLESKGNRPGRGIF